MPKGKLAVALEKSFECASQVDRKFVDTRFDGICRDILAQIRRIWTHGRWLGASSRTTNKHAPPHIYMDSHPTIAFKPGILVARPMATVWQHNLSDIATGPGIN